MESKGLVYKLCEYVGDARRGGDGCGWCGGGAYGSGFFPIPGRGSGNAGDWAADGSDGYECDVEWCVGSACGWGRGEGYGLFCQAREARNAVDGVRWWVGGGVFCATGAMANTVGQQGL